VFWILLLFAGTILSIVVYAVYSRLKKKRLGEREEFSVLSKENQVMLFGEFKAINNEGENISRLFTPKVKELFLFTLIQTQKNGIGASVEEINRVLWDGLPQKKVANNRSVTLNKLRKILQQFKGVEIVSSDKTLQLVAEEPFFCDYIDAFKLCQNPNGMTKQQLMLFFQLVKRGRFLKGITWPWLDEVRGFTGNQVIDNLLKLASLYKKENNLNEIEKIAKRILDYDDLSEEAIYLQVWALQKADNSHLAKFNFESFSKKYQENFGEAYQLNFSDFVKSYENSF
jgi:two-component SAPR family response regulator